MEVSFLTEVKRESGSLYIAELRRGFKGERIFLKETCHTDTSNGFNGGLTEASTLISLQESEWVPRFRILWNHWGRTYFGTDFMPGGDLKALLERRGRCTITETRTLGAHLTQAVESIHSLGWVHRDLKPEHLCLDSQGFLKIVSFKTCHRIGQQGDCDGLPVDYMAPEVITRAEPYDESVDVWSIGIILYEMLFGGPPFSDEIRDRNKSIYRIINSERYLWFPSGLNEEMTVASELIKMSLKPKQSRISLDGMKAHKFFRNVNWGHLDPFESNIDHEHIYRE